MGFRECGICRGNYEVLIILVTVLHGPNYGAAFSTVKRALGLWNWRGGRGNREGDKEEETFSMWSWTQMLGLSSSPRTDRTP
jgi:hypothetical protein